MFTIKSFAIARKERLLRGSFLFSANRLCHSIICLLTGSAFGQMTGADSGIASAIFDFENADVKFTYFHISSLVLRRYSSIP